MAPRTRVGRHNRARARISHATHIITTLRPLLALGLYGNTRFPHAENSTHFLVAARTQVWPRGGVSLWRGAQRTCTLCSTSLPLAEARLQVRRPPSPPPSRASRDPPPLAEPACMSRCSPRWALGAARRARRPDFHRCRRFSKQIGRMRAPAGHLGQPRWSRVGEQLVFCYNACLRASLLLLARRCGPAAA